MDYPDFFQQLWSETWWIDGGCHCFRWFWWKKSTKNQLKCIKHGNTGIMCDHRTSTCSSFLSWISGAGTVWLGSGFRYSLPFGKWIQGLKGIRSPFKVCLFLNFRAIFEKTAEVVFKTANFSDLFFVSWQGWNPRSWCTVYFRSTPHPATVTTSIITFLVGSPNKPLFATVSGMGGRCKVYYPLWSLWLFKFRNSEDGSKKNCTTEIPHLGEIVQIKSFRTKNGMEKSENPWTC